MAAITGPLSLLNCLARDLLLCSSVSLRSTWMPGTGSHWGLYVVLLGEVTQLKLGGSFYEDCDWPTWFPSSLNCFTRSSYWYNTFTGWCCVPCIWWVFLFLIHLWSLSEESWKWPYGFGWVEVNAVLTAVWQPSVKYCVFYPSLSPFLFTHPPFSCPPLVLRGRAVNDTGKGTDSTDIGSHEGFRDIDGCCRGQHP